MLLLSAAGNYVEMMLNCKLFFFLLNVVVLFLLLYVFLLYMELYSAVLARTPLKKRF